MDESRSTFTAKTIANIGNIITVSYANAATGDNSNIFLWTTLFFVSGGAVMITVIRKKKLR